MTYYENEADRENQREVMNALKQSLRSTPFIGRHFDCVECETTGDRDHDCNVTFKNEIVGIVEIKCRSYPAHFFHQYGYMISRAKLIYLYRSDQAGTPALLMFRSSDGHIFGAMIEALIARKHDWQRADPDRMATTDHGFRQRMRDDPGYILPIDLFQQLI